MRHFEQQLQDLLQKLTVMGSTAESMIDLAVRSLLQRSEALAEEVFAREAEVNRLQVQIDQDTVTLTATHQPVARDVRFLFGASRAVTDIERIADQAKNICQNARFVHVGPPLKPIVDLPLMADTARTMVHDAITALVRRDCALAEKVLAEEHKVDAFRDQVFRTLLTYMMADPGTIQRALSLILISRNLERIGDHASNIAEEVIYMVQGRDVRHATSEPKEETSAGT